ncbi:aldose epimerase family protein [Lentibacillus salicampi]|uniref:Galactose mutarotase n=1 Tax=Lentibacillus salicampi TaxID=175306 RepID=A0A4Y9AD88_9BACI|nr:aldose epimerase family protein [Lentibacillus salicampi]TFJ93077.1 galactose mutarotase [Lentibacillus salicampi]
MNVTSEQLQTGWEQFKFSNDNDMQVSVLNYGGIITEILVPDKSGRRENVVLSYKDFEDYKNDPNFFGAIIGRVAGRIQDASFTLGGNTYNLEANDGENCLHSGSAAFHSVIWDAEPFQTDEQAGVKLTHTSPDAEGGFPGTVDVTVTYTLNNRNQLMIDYEAISDKTTALALTNHTYFNLSGNLRETIKHHNVTMNSSRFAELDKNLIPTSNLLDVSGSPFDFREVKKLAVGIESGIEQNTFAGDGFDHYFLFDQENGNITVKEENSDRVMQIETNQPGTIMYSGNNLGEGLALKEGPSRKNLGGCFEM